MSNQTRICDCEKNIGQCNCDTIVESVINQYKQRSEVGIKKYGVTLDRTDLSLLDWVQHLQEELFDATLYLEKIKKELRDLK